MRSVCKFVIRLGAAAQQSTHRVAVLMVMTAMLAANTLAAQERSGILSPKALQEIAQVEAEIDRIEAQTMERLAAPPDNQVQQIELIGKLLLYDKQLSVNRNEACAFCHMPEVGFTGPVSELNRTTGSYPGSVRTRFSERKPQSTPMRRSPLCCITIRGEVTSSAAISGICVRPVGGWAIQRPSRHKGRLSTPWKWGCPILPAQSIAPRNGRIAPCSKACGGRKPLRSLGRATWSRSVPGQGRRPRVILCRCI